MNYVVRCGAFGRRIGIFPKAEFQATAESWNNHDFQSIIIHSYRFRYKNAEGDPRYKALESKLIGKPKINVPTVVLHGANDGASLVESSAKQEKYFTGFYERHVLEGVGHFVTREKPRAVVEAIEKLSGKAA